MKIRLIQPAQLKQDGKPTKFNKLFFPNLGLPTLAGITPAGIDIGITIEYVEEINFDEDIDLAAITAQTCQAPRAYQIADEFRKRGKKTILGGIHASVCPEEALRHFDSILIGEAENLWQEVIDDVKSGDIKRIYKTDHKPDLSELIIPRYDLLDYNHYIIPPLARTPLIPIQATRGCPHACDFCSVSAFWGHKIRKKPVENVIEEIETIKPSRIFFSDDNIGADPEYAMSLFSALKPLKIRWACQMSTTIGKHPELIKAAAESGCHETYMGVESLNEASLESIHKGFNKTAEYESLFKRLADVGILAQVSVIFGLDEDTPDELMKMIDKLLSWDINYLYIAILTPFPGTRLYERFEQENRLLDLDWSPYDVTRVVFQPRSMNIDQLENVMWQAYEKYYSAKNILKRAWRFKKQYVRYFPRDNALEELFFQFHIKNSVKQKCHPFSLGLEKKTHGN